MDEDLKRYADSLYENARMESADAVRKARVKVAEQMAARNLWNVPLSGPDVQMVANVFGEHIERCIVARFDSYHEAYSHANRAPSEADFAVILNDSKGVSAIEIGHSAKAIREFIGSRGTAGMAGLDIQAALESVSAHGHDGVVRKWKIWKAKVQLRPTVAKTPDTEKQRDVLLQIYSRAEFDRDLGALISGATCASPLAVAFMDLDKFKSINDGPGGHAAGDRALKVFAEAVLHACQGKGEAYRYGGDELCVLLPNHCLEESGAVAERIRREVSEIRTDELPIGLRTSVGVACFPESTSDASRLVSQADGAMYASKRAGGNRVTKAETD